MEICFFDFHEMGAPPRVMKNSLTDRRESRQDASRHHKKQANQMRGLKIKIPPVGSERKYLNTRRAAKNEKGKGFAYSG